MDNDETLSDAYQSEPAASNEPTSPDYETLKAERDSLYERLARATADFQNSRRRMTAEATQSIQYANEKLIERLLPVIDNFERALAVDPDTTDVPALLKGMQIVHDDLLKVLRDQNVLEVAPEAGEPFDPSLHQAMMQTNEIYPSPTVVQLLQKGYSLHGRTIRPAKVAVSQSAE